MDPAAAGDECRGVDGATTSKPGFVADVAGSYVATLTVSDGKVTASASVTITAQAQAPAPAPGIDGAALYTAKCAGMSRCDQAHLQGFGQERAKHPERDQQQPWRHGLAEHADLS